MHLYAQTNAQLFNQLRSEGYSKTEREFVRDVYEFGMTLFSGLFLSSGKLLMDHLVGTASILASLRVSIEIVAAGLIHAAYLHGDFGGMRQGITDAKRKRVKTVVGDEVEKYVTTYELSPLNWKTLATLQDHLGELSPVERNVLLMRLTNELEHELDLGGLYFVHSEKEQKAHQQDIEFYGPIMADLAERLGFRPLSDVMRAVFANVASTQIPLEPWLQGPENAAYLVVPRSCHQRFWVASYRRLLHTRFFGR